MQNITRKNRKLRHSRNSRNSRNSRKILRIKKHKWRTIFGGTTPKATGRPKATVTTAPDTRKHHSENDSAPVPVVPATSRKKAAQARLRRRVQSNIPEAPRALVTPRGSLMTTYTPATTIVENAAGAHVQVDGEPTRTTPRLEFAGPFKRYEYDHPLPLSFLSKGQTPADTSAFLKISSFPSTYRYLSQVIYDIL